MVSAQSSDATPTQPTPPIRIMLVDDYTMLRASTRRLPGDEGDLVLVGEAGDGAIVYLMSMSSSARFWMACSATGSGSRAHNNTPSRAMFSMKEPSQPANVGSVNAN